MPNYRNKLILVTTLYISLLTCGYAQTPKTSNFDLSRYSMTSSLLNQKDSTIAFINYLSNGKIEKAKSIYPQMFTIDVSSGIFENEEGKPYLAGLGEYYYDYSKDSNKLLALTVFLKRKHNSSLELYDQMLRGSLRIDSTNVAALYLLTKLRYEQNFKNDAYYLILNMYKLEGDNPEISRLYKNSKSNIDRLAAEVDRLGNNLPPLSDFVRREIYYPSID